MAFQTDTTSNERAVDERQDLQDAIDKWKKIHDRVASTTIDSQVFIYRSITRYEFRRIMAMELDDTEKEDLICELGLLYPIDYDLNGCKAGYITGLAKKIMELSYLQDPDTTTNLLASFREEMLDIDNQIDCIIKEAFPEFDLEDLPHWTIRQAYYYLSRAEWILGNLRGVQTIAQTLPTVQNTASNPAATVPEHIRNFNPYEEGEYVDPPQAPPINTQTLPATKGKLRKEYPPEYYNLPPEFRDTDSTLDSDFPEADDIFEDFND